MVAMVRELHPGVMIYRDARTGIAWVGRDGTAAIRSCHPAIPASGRPDVLKECGRWPAAARVVKCGGFYFNIDALVVIDEFDDLARRHCRCGGVH